MASPGLCLFFLSAAIHTTPRVVPVSPPSRSTLQTQIISLGRSRKDACLIIVAQLIAYLKARSEYISGVATSELTSQAR